MSGFAGVVCADGGTPDRKLIERMAERLVFRGPDATQIWTRPRVGTGFTLLRTGPSRQVDTQPCSLDGRVWLLGDVRLDGRSELRTRLEQYGEKNSADTTSEELILRAWRQWADKSFEYLIGDFSFALWDEDATTLWCVRDLMGAKPFFYAHAGGQLVFSNTLDAVRLAPDVSAKLDNHFIGDFLLQSWCPDPERSAFLDIRRLPAGHALKYLNGEVVVRRYASLPVEEPLSLKRGEDCIEQFSGHVEDAVRDRLPEGPAGIFMSGGLDSTSVAAVASRVQTARGQRDSMRAYTVDYTPLFEDQEGDFASRAAKYVGIPIEILSGASCEPFDGWEAASLTTPEPCAEPFLALHVKHYRHVAERARVVLSGDGGDDIMTGRAWPYLLYLMRRGRLGTMAGAFGGFVLRHGRLPPLRAGMKTRLRRWMGRADATLDYPTWLEPNFERETNLRDRWRQLNEPAESRHPVHPEGYASLTGAYWPNVFEGEDAGWTGVAVEARAPLLDQRLVRFLLRVPPVPWCMNKELLRTAMDGVLPKEVRMRKKTPLQGDPLLVHAEKLGWRATAQEGACEGLRMFVNCKMLSATSRPALGLSLWADLRPIALNYWLKSVENNAGIQYIQTGETE
jgi:asparagine synthase (glutamine-hydrolysing)